MAAEACLGADRKNKVAAAKARTVSDETKRCTVAPDFGATGAVAVNNAAIQIDLDLTHDVCGSDLDLTLITLALDSGAAKCQQAVTKSVKKCRDTRLKEFNKCKKAALKNGAASSQDIQDTCLGTGASGQPDAKQKIAKACDLSGVKPDKISGDIAKKCVTKGVDLATVFPSCDTAVAADLHDCLDTHAKCRVCQGLNAADGLSRDCDLFDDGLIQQSIGAPTYPPPGGVTFAGSGASGRAGGFDFSFSGFDLAALLTLYWGNDPAFPPQLAMDGAVDTGGETLSFDAVGSDLANGVAVVVCSGLRAQSRRCSACATEIPGAS